MVNVQTQIEIPCPTIGNLWVEERFRSGNGEETSDFLRGQQKNGAENIAMN